MEVDSIELLVRQTLERIVKVVLIKSQIFGSFLVQNSDDC